jgi:ADP-ribose pyrophosphatase YjhB (NUDIX family)
VAKTSEGPLVTVEVVLLTAGERDLLVYLRKRREAPFEGVLSLPGSLVRMGESTEEAAERVLETRTNLRRLFLQQLYTFSDPGRDPRGHSLSVSYYALFPTTHQRPNADPLEDAWVPLRVAIKRDLAFDHARILEATLKRLQGRLNYTGDAYYLLPERFTVPQLQHVHELILGTRLKPDVFTKRVRDSLQKHQTRETAPSNGAGRPARLFRNPVAPGHALVAAAGGRR